MKFSKTYNTEIKIKNNNIYKIRKMEIKKM